MIVAQAELHITLMWGLIVVSSAIAAFATSCSASSAGG